MKCPACSKELQSTTAGDVVVDICAGGCGGVWFDEGELEKFDEDSEVAAEVILKARTSSTPVPDGKQLRKCPRCPDQAIVRQFFDPKNQVEINQCWQCSGIWLDCGELLTIRGQFKTATDRAQAIEEYAEQCIDQSEKAIAEHGKLELAKYNEETSSRFKAFMYGFKQLLGH